MTIYKVRWYVDKRGTEGPERFKTERIVSGETTLIDNLETARTHFDNAVETVKHHCKNPGHAGRAELFVPYIRECGEISVWPWDGKYIAEYNSTREGAKDVH